MYGRVKEGESWRRRRGFINTESKNREKWKRSLNPKHETLTIQKKENPRSTPRSSQVSTWQHLQTSVGNPKLPSLTQHILNTYKGADGRVVLM